MIKLIAIDIDGTLLTSQKVLTQRVKETLQRVSQQGVKVVLCTGRPLAGVQSLLSELDLIAADQYVVTFNGSLVQTTDGSQIITDYHLTFPDIQRIQQFADAHNTYYHASTREAIYTTNKNIGKYTVREAVLVDMPIRYRAIEELQSREFFAQKAMIVDEPDRLDQVISVIPADMKDAFFFVKSAPYYLEVLHKSANKGSALQALAQALHVDLADVMAIGDNDNDLDMLRVAGYSVAMGNAVEKVKDIARYHTTTNDEDGVAVIIDQLVC